MTTLIATQFGALNRGLEDLIHMAAARDAPNSEYEQAIIRTHWIRIMLLEQIRVHSSMACLTADEADGVTVKGASYTALGGLLNKFSNQPSEFHCVLTRPSRGHHDARVLY